MKESVCDKIIEEQLKMIFDCCIKEDAIIQILLDDGYNHIIGLCECYQNLIDMSEEYDWSICRIKQCTIYSKDCIAPIASINGLTLLDFIYVLKHV